MELRAMTLSKAGNLKTSRAWVTWGSLVIMVTMVTMVTMVKTIEHYRALHSKSSININ